MCNRITRRKSKIMSLDELMEVCKAFNGNRKHDTSIGSEHGLSSVQVDTLRSILGKVEYSVSDISNDTKRLIVEAYNNGVSMDNIAKAYGFNHTAHIYDVLKQMGCEVNRKQYWTHIKEMNLVKLREVDKYTWPQISKMLGKSESACIYKYKTLKKNTDDEIRKSRTST